MKSTIDDLKERISILLSKYEREEYSLMLEEMANLEAREFILSYFKKIFEIEIINDFKIKLDFVLSKNKIYRIRIKKLILDQEKVF